jgi:O-antigen/teichoic acid export membrane protein
MRVASETSNRSEGLPETNGDYGASPSGGDEATQLLRRAPSGYLWNQAYSFWTFFALFLHSLVITNALSTDEKGVYALIEGPAVFAVYLAGLGLDTAATTYLPRAFAEGGRPRAVGVALRLIVLRLLGVLVVAGAVLAGLPAIAALLTRFQLPGADRVTAIVEDPRAVAHLSSIAGYIVAVGLVNILGSLLTALLRTRIIFIVGVTAQTLTIAFAWGLVIFAHTGADGALWALTIPNAVMAVIYAVALFRALGLHRASAGSGVTVGMLRLGMAAWLSDMANGPLVPLLAQTQLYALVALAGVSYTQDTAVGFFKTAYQLGDGATFLLVNGLGGVGLAVLSAAYVGRNRAHLATAWRTISKIQVLLGVPLLAFVIPHAVGIIYVYDRQHRYGPVAAMLGIYLALSAITRLAGGGAHSAVLYVLGRSRWVVFASWLALALILALDFPLIPIYGVAGALIAVGAAKIVAEVLQLVVAQRALRRPYPLGFMVRVLLALIPGVVFSYLWQPQSLLLLVVAGLGFTVLFVVSLLILRPLDAEDGALLDQVSKPLRMLLLPLVARSRRPAHLSSTGPLPGAPSRGV